MCIKYNIDVKQMNSVQNDVTPCLIVGISWQDKVTALRAKMTERKISWFVATALDEIACMDHISHNT